MIALLLNVFAAGRIGLGRHDAAIGKQRHPQCIGQLDPLVGIEINTEIPVTHLGHAQPGNQRKIADHHQPLDVVGVAEIQRLSERLRQTAHLCITCPEPLW